MNPPKAVWLFTLSALGGIISEGGLFYFAFFIRKNHFPHQEKYGIAMPFRTALEGMTAGFFSSLGFVTIP